LILDEKFEDLILAIDVLRDDEMDNCKIKNVIFDVGKVLIDWTPVDSMRKVGCSDDDIKLISERLFRPGIWDEEDRSVMSREELSDFFAGQVPELEDKVRAFYEIATETATLTSYAHEWIQTLKDEGYGVYILSNFGEVAWKKAVRDGAIDFLDMADGYLVSYMIHKIKPEPEIFEELLSRYGLKREECVFIDDAQRNIDGAEAIGIKGILFESYADACEKLSKILG